VWHIFSSQPVSDCQWWRVNDRVVPEAAEKTGAAVKSRDENSKLVMRAHCCITIRWSSSSYPDAPRDFFSLHAHPGPRACRREKIARQEILYLEMRDTWPGRKLHSQYTDRLTPLRSRLSRSRRIAQERHATRAKTFKHAFSPLCVGVER